MLPVAVFIICLLDTLFTCIGIQQGFITEKNPLVIKIIDYGGMPLFISVRVLSVAVAIFLLEKAKSRGVITIRTAKAIYSFVLVLYISVFIVFTLCVNAFAFLRN